jgi:hypothetical protein
MLRIAEAALAGQVGLLAHCSKRRRVSIAERSLFFMVGRSHLGERNQTAQSDPIRFPAVHDGRATERTHIQDGDGLDAAADAATGT